MRADLRLRHRRGVLELEDRFAVMGILNVTPDSFSDGGRFASGDDAIEEAQRMVARGADVIDVGGESTRPGATVVPVDEELRRVVPVIAGLRAVSNVVISVDTTKAAVAGAAVAAGADIVNDVSGFDFDSEMATTCARLGAGCVLMHTPARPDEMDRHANYEDVASEVVQHLLRCRRLATDAGIPGDAIALDPGFGFGKTPAQNYALLAQTQRLADLGSPILVGVSRKRMIRAAVGDDPAAVEHGSTAANVAALLAGASVVRVHDVVAGRAAADVAMRVLRGRPASALPGDSSRGGSRTT